MKLSIKWFVVFFVVGYPLQLWSEPTPEVSAPDQSVYKVNLAVDGTIIGITGMGAALSLMFESKLIPKQCPCDPNDVNSFDRPVIKFHSKTAADISNVSVLVALISPPIADSIDLGFSPAFWEDFIVYAEVLSVDSALSNLFRYTTQRPRPTAYQVSPAETEPADFASFYSGHTASVFAGLSAASMTYNLRYGPHVWPWVITAGVGFMEAGGRIASGRHFYSDVGVGIAAGTALGIAIPYLHERNKHAAVSLAPRISGDSLELVLQKKF